MATKKYDKNDVQMAYWKGSKHEAKLMAALRRIEKAVGNYNPAFAMAAGYHAEFRNAMCIVRETIKQVEAQ
jgi:hypothetical protein